MIQARIRNGRVEVDSPIPEEWEGQTVKIVPLTPDDPLPDLEARLAALAALGPMEFTPDERQTTAHALDEMDQIGRDAMDKIGK